MLNQLVTRVVADLQMVGSLRPGEVLITTNTRLNVVPHDDLVTAIRRALTRDSRERSLTAVRNCVRDAGDLISMISESRFMSGGSEDDRVVKRKDAIDKCLAALTAASNGIVCLADTYQTDRDTVSELNAIQITIQSILQAA